MTFCRRSSWIFCTLALSGWIAVALVGFDGEQTPAADTSSKPAVDPVVLNGEIFVDWPTPKAALVLSAELDGYLEPCGCAGLENQKGGLMRRHTLIQSLRDRGWPIAAVDAGGVIKRVGAQSEIKYRFAIESLLKMGYGAIGVGSNELQLSAENLAFTFSNLDPEKNPLTSANVGILGFESGFTSPYKILSVGKMKFGVISVLGAAHAQAFNRDLVTTLNPDEALRKTAPRLAEENCDVQILMVYGALSEARQLAAKYSQFDMVLATGGAEEPANRPGKIDGSRAMLIETGRKGLYVIVIGLYDDPKVPLRYQRVPLDARFADSEAMRELFVSYQNELESVGLAGLGVTGALHPDGNFVGSQACADCHAKAWAVFEKTPHAHATDTLLNLSPPRNFDPECLSCHATGWHPQQYFPYESGFLGVKETPELMHNGCENCHGPGANHVAAESGEADATDAQRDQLRTAMRRKIKANEGNKTGQALGDVVSKCLECHDTDNSPDFDFQKYWPAVKHEGVD